MTDIKKKLSIVYKFLIIILTTIGLYLNFKLANPRKLILYFTIISNLMVLLFYSISMILFLLKKLKYGETYHIFRGMITSCIMLTMVVYHIALTGTSLYQNHVLECNFVHLFVPLLVILDYLIFEEKGHIKRKQSLFWVMPLLTYGIFVEVYSMCGGLFLENQTIPYPFLDIRANGIIYVAGIFILFIVIFIILGFLSYKIDSLLKERERA